MANLRLSGKKQKRRDGERQFQEKIDRHKKQALIRTVLVAALMLFALVALYKVAQNHVYSGYATITSFEREQYDGTSVVGFQNGFVTYSKDGISYADSKGTVLWNKTYEMQSPMVSVGEPWIAVGDYNGHTIYSISEEGTVKTIDTNLPIRSLCTAENGVTAAVLEDTGATWINVYNTKGEKAISIKTTMQKFGYPVSVSLSPDGTLMEVSYLHVDSGVMKTNVAFYNFGEVGQNYTDTNVSGYEYKDSVIPLTGFLSQSTSYAVADEQLIFYSGDQIPKSNVQKFLNEEIYSVYAGDGYLGMVFLDGTGQGKYRMDIYSTSGEITGSIFYDMDCKDVYFYKDNVLIYDEAECLIYTIKGRQKFQGTLERNISLMRPLGGNKFLVVSPGSVDTIEMK